MKIAAKNVKVEYLGLMDGTIQQAQSPYGKCTSVESALVKFRLDSSQDPEKLVQFWRIAEGDRPQGPLGSGVAMA